MLCQHIIFCHDSEIAPTNGLLIGRRELRFPTGRDSEIEINGMNAI